MKKKLLVLTTLILAQCGVALAQQDKLITHFIYDKMSINPGATGMEEGICGTAIYRNQWDKVNGAPNSVLLNVEANMNRYFPGGVGVSFYHDAIGFNRQNNLYLNYSYPLELGNFGTLGIGVGLGMMNFGMNPSWVPPTSQDDATLPVGYNATSFDMNFGLYLKANNNWYVGISSTHLTAPSISKKVGQFMQSYDSKRHYYLMAGYTLKQVGGGDGDLDFQALLRTEFTKISSDINIRYIWRKMLYGGITYRTIDAVGLMVGYSPIKNLTIGYSYDITTNRLSNVSKGSHEIAVRYCYILPPVPVQKSKHPRWL